MNDDPIKSKIKQSMDAWQDSIDVQTQVKLNEARHAALTQKKPMLSKRFLIPITGFAAAIALAVLMIQNNAIESMPYQDSNLFEDLEMLTSDEADPDFYQDLEFLTWLDENQLMESEI
ncbi:MAG: hypothetical protein R3E90_01435 [Marinicella sp.]